MADREYDAGKKAELIAELDAARRELRAVGAGLREDANVPAHLKKSLQANMFTWIAGAVVGGLLLSALFRRRRKVKVIHTNEPTASSEERIVKAGILFTVAKFAFSVLEPVFRNILRKYVTDRFVH